MNFSEISRTRNQLAFSLDRISRSVDPPVAREFLLRFWPVDRRYRAILPRPVSWIIVIRNDPRLSREPSVTSRDINWPWVLHAAFNHRSSPAIRSINRASSVRSSLDSLEVFQQQHTAFLWILYIELHVRSVLNLQLYGLQVYGDEWNWTEHAQV